MSLRPQNTYVPGANVVECAVCGAQRLSTDVVPQLSQVAGGGTTGLFVCKEPERCNDPYHEQNDVGAVRREEVLPRIRQHY